MAVDDFGCDIDSSLCCGFYWAIVWCKVGLHMNLYLTLVDYSGKSKGAYGSFDFFMYRAEMDNRFRTVSGRIDIIGIIIGGRIRLL